VAVLVALFAKWVPRVFLGEQLPFRCVMKGEKLFLLFFFMVVLFSGKRFFPFPQRLSLLSLDSAVEEDLMGSFS
jgi:hypothetical protein